eukprot:TRINITY_DN580_c0_g2_i1.p1 TRINITY_DN580_c0_g2~~TRINITY_DN580_c0_g2_i1.p1  ORF type:complete len:409 (-),score=169.17 TRINITY_DN580_c0_g2_i1:13-1134(-)
MLRSEDFWTVEREAPLLNLNNGFLEKEGDALFDRVAKWAKQLGVTPSDAATLVPIVAPPGEPKRIFVADAERTFKGTGNRQKLIRLLSSLDAEFGDYHQGLSYVASFLLLFLDEATVRAMLVKLNSSEFYMKDYWRAESFGSARDAHVFDHVLRKVEPSVPKHLDNNTIACTTYCTKWFVGLCIHVLPYESLFPFLDAFFEKGWTFVLQFGLSLMDSVKETLLKSQNPAVLFGLLRLEPKQVSPAQTVSIVEKASSFSLDGIDLDAVRAESLKTVSAAIETARQRRLKLEAQDAEEESEEELTDTDDDDEGGECALCGMMPEFYCAVCKCELCEECKDKKKDAHEPSHAVITLEEKEDAGDGLDKLLAEKLKI